MSYRTLKRIYVILAGGVVLGFFGHGAWAAFENNEKFRGLLSGTLNHVFGAHTKVGDAGISTAVQTIGWTDLAFAAGIVALAFGVYRGHGVLARFATSRVAIGMYTWAALWGFLTAGSRVTAAGAFYPEVWDVVERGPNFLLPAAMIYITYVLRRPTQFVGEELSQAETAGAKQA